MKLGWLALTLFNVALAAATAAQGAWHWFVAFAVLTFIDSRKVFS